MPKYSVNASVVGSKHLGVFEADTKEKAIEMALSENGSVNLCHHCSCQCQDPEIDDVTAEKEAE
jgi:hypothetical protein